MLLTDKTSPIIALITELPSDRACILTLTQLPVVTWGVGGGLALVHALLLL